jgi:hypothetical protein
LQSFAKGKCLLGNSCFWNFGCICRQIGQLIAFIGPLYSVLVAKHGPSTSLTVKVENKRGRFLTSSSLVLVVLGFELMDMCFLESLPPPLHVLLCSWQSLTFAQASLGPQLSYLCLLSSWDYRYEPSCLALGSWILSSKPAV